MRSTARRGLEGPVIAAKDPSRKDSASLLDAPHAAHAISIPALDIAFEADDRTNLLKAMIDAGQNGLMVGCRGGGCGVCRIQVLEGCFVALPMSRQRISPEDEGRGIVLACRVVPRSAMIVAPAPLVPGYSRAAWRPGS